MIRSLIWSMVLSCLAAAAQAGAGVEILAPTAGRPLFGVVTLTAVVTADEEIETVDFAVDGRPVGSISIPPYTLQVDVGGENRSHLIEVVVEGRQGELARATLTSPAVQVDERVDLELQQLYAVVTNRRGNRILGLKTADFSVTDDGVRQRLITLAGGDIPLTATLLVDASGSMLGDGLEVALRGAQAFLDGMADLDEARVMVASDRLRFITPFSDDAEALRRTVALADAGGGTAVFDHLAIALLGLEARHGRRVVIVLSDGLDMHSVLGHDELTTIARSSQAVIYWVRLRSQAVSRRMWLQPVPVSAWRDAPAIRALQGQLETLVARSGGRVVAVKELTDTEGAFRDILQELREQYAIGYYPDPRRNDGRWRPALDLRTVGDASSRRTADEPQPTFSSCPGWPSPAQRPRSHSCRLRSPSATSPSPAPCRRTNATSCASSIAAVGSFPDEPQLRLQLIHSLALESAWTAIDEIVPTLHQAQPQEDQPSPRLLYNIPRRDELEAELIRFEQRVSSQFPATVHVMTLAPRNGDPQP